MRQLKKVTVVKLVHYVFLGLTISWALLLLLDLGAYLRIGEGGGGMLRGWVNFGYRPVEPDQIQVADASAKVFDMGRHHFAMVNFEHLGDMLWGLPLFSFLCQLLSELAIVMVFYHMMRLFSSLDQATVFRDNQIPRLRYIAGAVVTFSLCSYLQSQFLALYLRQSGPGFQPVYPAIPMDRLVLGVLVALVILALLKAFQIGNELQKEQDLTI